MSERTPVVEVRGICKRFGATQAVDGVDLDVQPGEVHALVGENGAGKSTLGKLIGGIHGHDAGELLVRGWSVRGTWDTKRALGHGIAMIQQELSLVPGLTVEQNVFLGLETHTAGFLRRGLRRRFEQLNERSGFGLRPNTVVGDLAIAERQKVEIMRALAREAQLVIMDEPTSSLSAVEIDKLHELIQWLKQDGRSVIYVTHFLDAALEQSDRVTVMRDGRKVRTARSAGETKQSLVGAMIGQPLEIQFPDRAPPPAERSAPALEVRHLRRSPMVHDVSFTIAHGEIVGIAGLMGSGRSELARAIFGAEPPESGEILLAGRPYDDPSPSRSVRRGLALVPEDRRHLGLVLSQPVRPNVTLPHLPGFSSGPLVSRRAERHDVASILEELRVVPRQVDGDVSLFSGGNQQKVLFAKWMVRRPTTILLDEPTRGVDVGAKARIYDVIVGLARSGTAVLLISSELEEVLGLSHRVHLMDRGRFVGEIDPRTTTVDSVLYQLFGLADQPVPSADSEGERDGS